MTGSKNSRLPLAGVGLLFVTAAAIGAIAAIPEKAIFWIGGASFVPLAWLGLMLLRRRGIGEKEQAALFGSSMILSIALGTKALEGSGAIEGEAAARIVGVALGAALVVIGNAMPKVRRAACETPRSVLFAGWLFMVLGIAVMLANLLLPVGTAQRVLLILGPLVLLGVAMRAGVFSFLAGKGRP